MFCEHKVAEFRVPSSRKILEVDFQNADLSVSTSLRGGNWGGPEYQLSHQGGPEDEMLRKVTTIFQHSANPLRRVLASRYLFLVPQDFRNS